MTNTLTNLCYIVNPVSVGLDWDLAAEHFALGFKCGLLLGVVVWVAFLVKSGLRVPFWPRSGE